MDGALLLLWSRPSILLSRLVRVLLRCYIIEKEELVERYPCTTYYYSVSVAFFRFFLSRKKVEDWLTQY